MFHEFQRCVEENKDQVFSFAFYYLGNQEEAEDVTQDVLLRLWQSWRAVEIRSAPRWLNRVTRNACFDRLRRRRVRRIHLTEEDGAEVAKQVAAREPGPHDEAVAADFEGRLRRLLSQLPEPYRSALIMREIQELNYREISLRLELPINTVKTHVHRGRKLLREGMRQCHGDKNLEQACLF